MKKFDYKNEIGFFMWEDYDISRFNNKLSGYFKKKYGVDTEFIGKNKEYFIVEFLFDNNYVKLEFKYDDTLFYNCYKSNGIYECEKYVGTRGVIHKLFTFLFDEFLIITKNEPLLCHKCGEPTGILYNDLEADEKSIGACGTDPKQLYDYYEEGINKCYRCGEYFCNDCYDYESEICEECEENEFNEYKTNECDNECCDCVYDNRCNYEDNLLDSNWKTCRFEESDDEYENCDGCEFRDECVSDAEDNRSGYASFCDIVSDAYGSVDAFWECNGI